MKRSRYYAPNLSLGEYEVRAELPGFSAGVRSGIHLTVGREAVVDLQLKVGQISENFTVSGEAPLIQLTTAVQIFSSGQSRCQAIPGILSLAQRQAVRCQPCGILTTSLGRISAALYWEQPR